MKKFKVYIRFSDRLSGFSNRIIDTVDSIVKANELVLKSTHEYLRPLVESQEFDENNKIILPYGSYSDRIIIEKS